MKREVPNYPGVNEGTVNEICRETWLWNSRVNIAELGLLSRDLIQNPLGSSTVPTPQILLQPAHPAGTQQLCCDTKLSLPIAFLCSLLNNWDPPLKCSFCSARLAGNWKCSWGFCVAHNKLSWNAEFSTVLGICSLQDGYSQPVRDPNTNFKVQLP